MNLRLHRKFQICPFVGNARFRKQQPWYFVKLTKKQKGLFKRNRFFFSTEAQRRFSRAFLYRQASLNNYEGGFAAYQGVQASSVGFLGASSFHFRNLLGSSLWVYQNPTLVPGTLKVRRFKGIFSRYHNASRMLSVWLGKVQKSWLHQIYHELLYYKNSSAWGLLRVLESQPSFTLLKAGWAFSNNEASVLLKHGKVVQNSYWCQTPSVLAKRNFVYPGDFFCASFSLSYRNLKAFHHRMLKSYKI